MRVVGYLSPHFLAWLKLQKVGANLYVVCKKSTETRNAAIK